MVFYFTNRDKNLDSKLLVFFLSVCSFNLGFNFPRDSDLTNFLFSKRVSRSDPKCRSYSTTPFSRHFRSKDDGFDKWMYPASDTWVVRLSTVHVTRVTCVASHDPDSNSWEYVKVPDVARSLNRAYMLCTCTVFAVAPWHVHVMYMYYICCCTFTLSKMYFHIPKLVWCCFT